MDSKEMGKIGGHARAKKLSAKRRREIAMLAAQASVAKRRNGKPKNGKPKIKGRKNG